MTVSKIIITLDENLLREVDSWVEQKLYTDRSQAVQTALFDFLKKRLLVQSGVVGVACALRLVRQQVNQLTQQRLEAECAKLDPQEEREFAEMGIEKTLNGWCQY